MAQIILRRFKWFYTKKTSFLFKVSLLIACNFQSGHKPLWYGNQSQKGLSPQLRNWSTLGQTCLKRDFHVIYRISRQTDLPVPVSCFVYHTHRGTLIWPVDHHLIKKDKLFYVTRREMFCNYWIIQILINYCLLHCKLNCHFSTLLTFCLDFLFSVV